MQYGEYRRKTDDLRVKISEVQEKIEALTFGKTESVQSTIQADNVESHTIGSPTEADAEAGQADSLKDVVP